MSTSSNLAQRLNESGGLGGIAWIFAVIAAMISIAVVLARCGGAEHHPFDALPAEERDLLLQRTLDNLELCRRHPDLDGLEHFCADQAALARALPGCDDACRALAAAPSGDVAASQLTPP